MIEGKPRESLIFYDNAIEVSAHLPKLILNISLQVTPGMDINDPFKKSFGGKFSKLWTQGYNGFIQAPKKALQLLWKTNRPKTTF